MSTSFQGLAAVEAKLHVRGANAVVHNVCVNRFTENMKPNQ